MQILIAGRDKQVLTSLKAKLVSPEFEISVNHISNGHASPLYGAVSEPDLLIYCVDAAAIDEITSLAETPAEGRPATLIIGPAGNTLAMKMAMKAGVRDYLEEPVDDSELFEAIQQIYKDARDQDGSYDGNLIAVVGAKGGSGASFLSVNIAHMMAAASGLRVALVDMDLQFGSLGQYLDLNVEHGLLRALDMAEHLDGVAVDAYMTKHKSGLSMLAPLQEEVVLPRDIPVDRFTRLLDLMKDNYDSIIVDQPRQIDDLSAVVYAYADRILLVMQQDIANLRDAARLRRILVRELGVDEKRIHAVVNRYDKSLPVEISDICRSLSVSNDDLLLVPNHYQNVAESINVGVPMLDHARGSAVTKALLALEHRLAGEGDESDRPGLFARAFSQLTRG